MEELIVNMVFRFAVLASIGLLMYKMVMNTGQ